MFVRILLVYFIFITSLRLYCQELKPVYQNFTEKDGLPSNYLNCLFQDSKGFIWIGSDKGLTRYDGIRFKTYTTDDGLSGNMILDIEEDELGQLWIGTFERGLCRFDGSHFDCWGSDYNIKSVATIKKPINNNIFYSAGSGKLALFNTKTLSHKTLIDLPLQGIQNSIISLKNNKTLFPCAEQIFQISEKGEVKKLNYPQNKNGFHIKTGRTTKDGKTWLLNSNSETLLQAELRKNKLVFLDTLPGMKFNASIFEGNKVLISNYVKNNYYNIINPKDKSIKHIPNPHLGQNEDILVDREGQIWLATIGYGLFVKKGYPYLHQLPLQQGAAYDIEILPNKKILVGGDKGIWIYDEKLHVKGYQKQIEQVRGVKKLDGIGVVAGTLQGATYFFENEKKIVKQKQKPDIVVKSGFSNGLQLEDGRALFSSYGAGLQVFSKNKLKPYPMPSLPNLMVEGLFKTSHGIWATSSSDGVLNFNTSKNQIFTKKTGLASNNVYTVFESTKDSVWIGTENGATLWNGKHDIKTYTKKDGLIGKRITAFFKDKNQVLWAFSDKYLHQWRNKKWHAIKSVVFQNMPAGRVYDVAYDANYNRVFIASTTGAFVLDLGKIEPMKTPVNFVLESVSSKKGLLDTTKLNTLDANNNSIKINFSLPSYTRSTENTSYFRFLGQENWVAKTNHNRFQYDNLPSGNYTLQVVTANPDGVKGNIKTLTTFKILKPIWLQWWAITLEIIVAIGIAVGLVTWYFKRKEKKRLAKLEIERELQNERERISRDLHDNIGAQLTNITYKLDLAAYQTKNDKKNEQIEKISDDTRNTITLLRDTIWALQKDEFSLEDLTNKFSAYINRLNGIPIQFEIETELLGHWLLSPKEVLHIFRIFQEAIQNIIKHANAKEVKIIIRSNDQQFNLQINDNGKGFSPSKKDETGHYGLQNMEFRAKKIGAEFSICKNHKKGTSVNILKKKYV